MSASLSTHFTYRDYTGRPDDSRLPSLPTLRVSGTSVAAPPQTQITFANRSSHRWQTEAVGSSPQIRCVSCWCCRYRVMAKSASRAASIIQILTRIRAPCPRLACEYFDTPTIDPQHLIQLVPASDRRSSEGGHHFSHYEPRRLKDRKPRRLTLFLTIAATARGDSPFTPRGDLELPHRLLCKRCVDLGAMGIGRN